VLARPEETMRDKALILFRKGQVAEALELLKDNRDDMGMQVLLREHLVGEGNMQAAMPLIERLANQHGAEAHVSRSIAALAGGDVQAAARECETALRMDARLATAHNHLARARHNLGRGAEALESFRQAIDLDPGYAQAWYNLAHVYRATGRLVDSIQAYQQALELAPGFQAARLNLGITQSLADEPAAALANFEQLLEADPAHVEARVNAGLALHVLGRLDAARRNFEQVLEQAPRHANAWCYLGILLNEQLDTEGSRQALLTALKLNPGDIEARVELAGVYEQSNNLEDARQAVEEGLRLDPSHPALKLEAARLERRSGNASGALEVLNGIRPDRLPPRLAQQFFFERGQALDRNGDWDEAFEAFRAGNELASRSPRRAAIDPGGFERRCGAITDWLGAGAPGIEPGAGELDGDTGADLCFLIGFPRSGTTLLDTFLNAHKSVYSIEEKPTLERIVEALRDRGQGYPGVLEDISSGDVAALRSRYRQELDRQAGPVPPTTTLLLDKLPMRTLNVGLIQRLFPRAKLLFALRHPCDVVLSNFMQSYADNEAFIHFDTLEESANMYRRVMDVWVRYQPYLGLDCLPTRYEDLVADAASEMGRICGFLGLETSEEMLDLETRLAERGRIRTNSYQQVAEPVYTRAAGRWTHYARHFGDALPGLQPFIERFGYAAAENGGEGQ